MSLAALQAEWPGHVTLAPCVAPAAVEWERAVVVKRKGFSNPEMAETLAGTQ